MRSFAVQSLEQLLAEGPVTEIPYDKSFQDGDTEPFIIIHTSGSTGLLKPITIRQGGLATLDAQHLLPPLDGYEPQINMPDIRIAHTMPPFHVSWS